MNQRNETAIQPAGLGETRLAQTGGTMSDMLAARAAAEVNACYIVAERNPRSWEQVGRKLLDAVKRPGFAGHAGKQSKKDEAWYEIPMRGSDPIEGFSIRFAEEAMRAMGNLDADTVVVWDGDLQRMLEVRVIDFETNVRVKSTVVVDKTVERASLRDDEIEISRRTNSRGKTVYLRKATEDELFKKQNNAVSKAIRNGVLKLLPGDIQNECKNQILDIRHGEVVEDPTAYHRMVVDSFAKIGVPHQDLISWLGHDLSTCSPKEFENLELMYNDIQNRKTTWSAVLQAKADREREHREPAANARNNQNQQPSIPKEQPPGQKQPQVVNDPIAELKAVAKQRFGQKWEEGLNTRVHSDGYKSVKDLTDDQARDLTAIMRQELRGYINADGSVE